LVVDQLLDNIKPIMPFIEILGLWPDHGHNLMEIWDFCRIRELGSGSLYLKVILPIFFTERQLSVKRSSVKWCFGHLTEHRLTEHHLTERPFDRNTI
jgi:hypothetical protein